MSELLSILVEFHVEVVVDVRRWPESSRIPLFTRDNLRKTLEKHGIKYVWLGDTLGGYRRGGYESYMETEEYRRGLSRLEEIARSHIVAVLCAERLWFRCHRRFIAESLVRDGFKILHIVEKGVVYEHWRRV
ncbi:MAG: DUF488 family protein [Infirmifilum sp.]|uniref:DUF488 domain-containing protein n=1 Tax=Infirmifilum TaxID=2856573 RepID=UPI002353F8D3